MEEHFLCSLCYEIFAYPVTLPCKHRFCKLCLDKHFDNNGFTCPLCRTRVSNWLRKLKLNEANLVDTAFWKLIKATYPIEVGARLSGTTDVQVLPIESGDSDDCEIKIVIINQRKRENILNEHAQCSKLCVQHIESWEGWPDKVSTVCRDVAWQVSEQIASRKKLLANERPKLNISQPGEIRKEYEEFLRKEQEENSKEEEKNMRLSKELIAMIEEDEAKENEKRLEQLRVDEELARRLEEESRSNTEKVTQITPMAPNRRNSKTLKSRPGGKSGPSKHLNSKQGVLESFMKAGHSPVNTRHDYPNVTSHPVCSTPKPAEASLLDSTIVEDISQIPLDTPSTSKDDIFSKNYKRTAQRKSRNSSHESINEPETTQVKSAEPVPYTFSSPELSHFASVIPRPSNSVIEPTNMRTPMSRSSSGSDSIGQELRHFKPIRTSPTTPTKDGYSSCVPQVVVAQRGTVTLEGSSDVVRMLCEYPESDISAQDIEDSIALEKQIQADHELAAMLQKEWEAAESKRKRNGLIIKTDYNLRNKKKRGNLRKNVLVDHAQTTLDTMLIK